MVEVILNLPRDSSFLSSVLYEGLLFSALHVKAEYDGLSLDLPNDFLSAAFKKLEDVRIDSLRVAMSGNDNVNVTIFEAYGIPEKSRKTYYDLISKLKSNADRMTVTKSTIKLGAELKRKDMIIDEKEMFDANGKRRALSAPQLFKIDRYTGISSLESSYTSQQVTIYTSKEILLIFLLGLYSSFVTSVRQQSQQYHFFLTFSPEEIENMLNNLNDKEFVERVFRTKEGVMRILNDVLSKTTLNEMVLLEIYLNVEIRTLMERENLDKISTTLFKISPEGQTYKIYEQMPITIYRDHQEFHEIVERFFRSPEEFLENLSEILKPDGVIFDALRNVDKYDEASNVVKAVYGLYRFIVLGNADGWYDFLREISNACRKLENSTKPNEKKRYKKYLDIVKKFS